MLICGFCFSCGAKKNSNKSSNNTSEDLKTIVKSDNAFGLDLFQKIVSEDKNSKNVFISPTSIQLALAMTYNGADGTTKEAMATALKKNNLDANSINNSYKSLTQFLQQADSNVVLEIANAIYYKEGFAVKSDFIKSNATNYNAEVKGLDFKSKKSVDIINNWVASNTNNKIETIIDELSPDAVMVLLNAIYFYGSWEKEFNPEHTMLRPFFVDANNKVDVKSMYTKDTLGYYAHDKFQLLEIPYGNGNYNMCLFLPEMNTTVDDFISSMNPTDWENWISSIKQTDLTANIPKFSFEYEIPLKKILANMGMNEAFGSSANFANINEKENLFISEVFHKTFVDVSEKGTEAAAVTNIVIKEMSLDIEPPIVVEINRPFVFAIVEKQTDAIVFLGKVLNPSAK